MSNDNYIYDLVEIDSGNVKAGEEFYQSIDKTLHLNGTTIKIEKSTLLVWLSVNRNKLDLIDKVPVTLRVKIDNQTQHLVCNNKTQLQKIIQTMKQPEEPEEIVNITPLVHLVEEMIAQDVASLDFNDIVRNVVINITGCLSLLNIENQSCSQVTISDNKIYIDGIDSGLISALTILVNKTKDHAVYGTIMLSDGSQYIGPNALMFIINMVLERLNNLMASRSENVNNNIMLLDNLRNLYTTLFNEPFNQTKSCIEQLSVNLKNEFKITNLVVTSKENDNEVTKKTVATSAETIKDKDDNVVELNPYSSLKPEALARLVRKVNLISSGDSNTVIADKLYAVEKTFNSSLGMLSDLNQINLRVLGNIIDDNFVENFKEEIGFPPKKAKAEDIAEFIVSYELSVENMKDVITATLYDNPKNIDDSEVEKLINAARLLIEDYYLSEGLDLPEVLLDENDITVFNISVEELDKFLSEGITTELLLVMSMFISGDSMTTIAEQVKNAIKELEISEDDEESYEAEEESEEDEEDEGE